MFRRVFNWMFPKNEAERPVRIVTPDDVIDDDPIVRELVARCVNSGGIVHAHVDEDGEVHFSNDDEG